MNSKKADDIFYTAIDNRKVLYQMIKEKVKECAAIITIGDGWYLDLVNRQFDILGVQNLDGIPHFLVIQTKVGNMTVDKLIQWDHCKIISKSGKKISITNICKDIAKTEVVITGAGLWNNNNL